MAVTDEFQPFHIHFSIEPIAGAAPGRGPEQPFIFVVADSHHPAIGQSGRLTYRHTQSPAADSRSRPAYCFDNLYFNKARYEVLNVLPMRLAMSLVRARLPVSRVEMSVWASPNFSAIALWDKPWLNLKARRGESA